MQVDNYNSTHKKPDLATPTAQTAELFQYIHKELTKKKSLSTKNIKKIF